MKIIGKNLGEWNKEEINEIKKWLEGKSWKWGRRRNDQEDSKWYIANNTRGSGYSGKLNILHLQQQNEDTSEYT